MKEMICITCPNSCRLLVDVNTMEVTGHKCPRGVIFAHNELKDPKRSVTSTVRTSLPGYPVVSVRTDGDIPKNKIKDLMDVLRYHVVNDYCPRGTVIIRNIFDTGIDIITTSSLIKEK